MIKKYLSTEYDGLKAICDDLDLPFYNYCAWFKNRSTIPFIYGVGRDGKDFVLLGNRGSTHKEILSDFYTELHCIGCGDRENVLCGRIFTNNSLNQGSPRGFLAFWLSDGPPEYSSSKKMKRIAELLKNQNMDISGFSIVVERCNNIILEEVRYREREVYEISLEDYIALNLSNLKDLPAAYERQERKSNYKYNRPEWEQFDDGSGNSHLGYHLMTRQDENMKQGLIKLNRKSLMEAIKNSFKTSLKEMTENGSDMTEQLKSAIMNIYRSTNLKYRMAEYESVFKIAIENGLSQEDLINAFSSCGLDCTKNPRSKARFDEIWSSLSSEKQDSDYINEEHTQNYNQLALIAQKMVSNLSPEEKALLKKVVDMFDGERGWDLKYTLRDALSGNEETI